MPPLRVVFDTNIYVMAAGIPGGYIDSWLELATPPDGKFVLYTSPAILAEVQEKLEQKLSIERALAVEYIDKLSLVATVVMPTGKLDVVKDDPYFNQPHTSTTPSPTSTPITGDINGDGKIDISDLSALLSAWGTSNTAADINHDGTVNVLDLSTLLSNWNP